MDKLTVRVGQRINEAQGICSFELLPLFDKNLPAFSAGAHLDVHVAPGLIRQYSLCNDPADRNRYQIAVLREAQSRGGSAGMHDLVNPGDRLQVSAPRNHFPLVPAQRTLLLAGGIGVTPILSMARALHAQGADFEMHYCGRSLSRMAFVKELQTLPFAHRVFVHTDDGETEQQFEVEKVLAQPAIGTHLYVCGPSGFMKHVLDAAQRLGWPEEQLHREYFAGTVTKSESDGVFEVRLASSGQNYRVPPDKSVIEVLSTHGVEIPFSCESGICGTCLTGVLDGTPDHRDTYLTAAEKAENHQFTPCCSRALSPVLVLDL